MPRSSKTKLDTPKDIAPSETPPKPIGRPTKLTPDVQEIVVKAIRSGATHDIAAMAAGIHRDTFYDWKSRGEAGEPIYSDFSDALKTAEAQGALNLLERIQSASEDPKYWPAAAWILERRYPETYGKQRIEHTGKDGAPMEHVFTIEWTDDDDNSGHS